MNRVQWVDKCKGIGILLVLLGHTLRTDISLVYIYGFHMPLFFFLSGLVCNEKKYNWASFITSRFNTLIIPYIAFYLLTWLYWLFVERSFRPLGMDWWEPLVGMVYGAQWRGFMDHNGILWFLPCLFVTEILFFMVKSIKYVGWQLGVILVLTAIGMLIKSNLPWCLNIAAVALQFFFVGNSLRTYLLKETSNNKRHRILIVGIVLAVGYIIAAKYWGNEAQMAVNRYGNIIAFESLAFIGILSLAFMCKSLVPNNFNWGGYLGRNTLVIFAFHQPLLRIVRFVGANVFTSFPVETNMFYASVADATVILALVPLIWLWNKYGIKALKKIYI